LAYSKIVVKFELEDADYRRLLKLRVSLRQYLHWSEQQAQAVGLTPAHHQLLLAIRGHDDPRGPTIGDVAGYLLLKHHSTVELVQRAGALGLLERFDDPEDGRVVRLALTEKGTQALERLSSLHYDELSRMVEGLWPLWQGSIGSSAAPRRWPPDGDPRLNGGGYPVRVRRIYDDPVADDDDGTRVLVDRIWPRDVRKDASSVDQWLADVAPSTELRRWYGRKSERFAEFSSRYLDELRAMQAGPSLDRLDDLARHGPLTLLTAASDVLESPAAVLAGEIRRRTGAVNG
jgi:uncharacterized protein YeaO (DUF488 family)/DNA-binding MarR family transcriptional regulator